MKKLAKIIVLIVLLTPFVLKAQNLEVVELNTEQFKQLVIDYTQPDAKFMGDKPTIVDFYATWCRPCKMLAPHLEELMKEYDGKIVIYKVNVDKEKPMCQAIGIRAMPTLLMFDASGQMYTATGYREKAEMKALIEENLKP